MAGQATPIALSAPVLDALAPTRELSGQIAALSHAFDDAVARLSAIEVRLTERHHELQTLAGDFARLEQALAAPQIEAVASADPPVAVDPEPSEEQSEGHAPTPATSAADPASCETRSSSVFSSKFEPEPTTPAEALAPRESTAATAAGAAAVPGAAGSAGGAAAIDTSDFSPEELEKLRLLRRMAGGKNAAALVERIRAEREGDQSGDKSKKRRWWS